MKLRHELKHVINYADYFLVKNRLRSLLHQDQHALAHGEYRVRSLYFDDPFDTALREKIAGVSHREKFRLRCYNEDYNLIRLEKKSKFNNLSEKISARLSRGQVEQILAGEIGFLRESGDPLLLELYAKMRGKRLQPRTIVEYIREPFTHPAGNTRITLDRDIRTGLSSLDFFHADPLHLPIASGLVVLEVKFDQYLPDIVKRAIALSDRRTGTFSKYAAARKFD